MPSDDFGWIFGILAIVSLASFFGLFWFLKHGRLMQDTPTSKIRSASQGYVEIKGRAKHLDEEKPVKAPASNHPCVWYKYVCQEQYRDSKGRTSWKTIERDESFFSFFVDDGTGRCAVDPEIGRVIASFKKTWRVGDLRHIEERIHEGDDVYCLGNFETEQGPSTDEIVRIGMGKLLNQLKSDRERLLKYFDKNNDGEIDMKEWEMARAAARKEVEKRMDKSYTPTEHHCLVKPFDKKLPYLISGKSEELLVKHYRWYSSVLFASFIGAGAYAVFMAISRTGFLQ
jgi:hypothetical protein